MKPFTIACPTGHLAFTPLEKESFLAGCRLSPYAIVADAGSCDIGPRPLRADRHVSLEVHQRHDLEIMLLEARRLGVPMIVGSASDTGTDRGVDQFVGLLRAIAAEHRLAPFRPAAIYSEQKIEDLLDRLARGARIEGLDGRPDADASTLRRTSRVVAVMNAEPIRRAPREGAEVVIAGRASDCALFAAPLLQAGFSPAIAYYTGKLMECASFACEPYMGKETILGTVEGESVRVRAMHPAQRCTPASLASHAVYERTDPLREHVAGGWIDMSACCYERVDEKSTRASGAVFHPTPTIKVELEGAGRIGERRLVIVGVRDPQTIARIDDAIAWARGKVVERFGPEGEGYRLFYHRYGRDAVMKELDPDPPAASHELGIVVEAVHDDARIAEEIAALAARNLFYARLSGTKGTVGAAALMSDEILIREPGYEWTLNHVIEVEDVMELVRIRQLVIDGRAGEGR